MERDIGDLTGSSDLGESELSGNQNDESELRHNGRGRKDTGSRRPPLAFTEAPWRLTDSGKGVTA